MIAGRPEAEALAALRIVCEALADAPALQKLDLSDNALGEKGIRACAAAITNKVGANAVAQCCWLASRTRHG